MEEVVIEIYGSINMIAFISIGCFLLGASATNVNGHKGESTGVHMKHMLDGGVMGLVVGIFIAMPAAKFLNLSPEMSLIIVAVSAIVAPGVLRYIKLNGMDWVTGLVKRGK